MLMISRVCYFHRDQENIPTDMPRVLCVTVECNHIWQRAFGKDFGGMAQGCNKTGQKGTNAIFVMTHTEIPNIPKDRTVTYARVVVDFRPHKEDPHRIRITVIPRMVDQVQHFDVCSVVNIRQTGTMTLHGS